MSLHQRIVTDLETAIKTGVWKPGERIPYEQELTAQYNCARMTVSKAISALVAKGMIIRKRRAGSFVALPAVELAVLRIQDISEEVIRTGGQYTFKLIKREKSRLDSDEAGRIGEKAGTEVVRLETLHFVDGQPHSLEKRIVLTSAVPQVWDEPFSSEAPGAWLLKQVPWSDARHVIRAVSADAVISRTLHVEKGAACLLLIRQTWQSGRTVTYVEMFYAADQYQFAGVFQPEPHAASAKQNVRR